MVQRLARSPFKAKIRVRFPLALPTLKSHLRYGVGVIANFPRLAVLEKEGSKLAIRTISVKIRVRTPENKPLVLGPVWEKFDDLNASDFASGTPMRF
jgi:hypothetical protein